MASPAHLDLDPELPKFADVLVIVDAMAARLPDAAAVFIISG